MPMSERRRVQPRFEGSIIPPPCQHQPGGPLVRRLEKLETFEAILVVDGARPRGEPAGQLVPALSWHGDRVDLYHGHMLDDASSSHGRRRRVPAAAARLRPPPAAPRRGGP